MSAPVLLCAVPLLTGAAAGIFGWAPGQEGIGLAAACAALLALLAASAATLQDDPLQFVGAMVAGSALVGLSIGHLAADRAHRAPIAVWWMALDEDVRASPMVVEGTLRSDASGGPSGSLLVLDVHTAEAAGARLEGQGLGGIRLSVAGELAADRLDAWRAGRVVRVSATLRRPTLYRNPGARDDERSLERRGLALVGSIKSGALVDVTREGGAIDERSARVRRWVRRSLADAVGRWSSRSAGIATAILIGDRTGLSRDDERRLQEAGTYHVIAISGGNIAILAGILIVVLRAGACSMRLASAVTIGALLFYGQVANAEPSVARAITAGVIYLAGRVLDHKGSALNTLGVAAVLGAAFAPLTIVSAGFVLSFGATLGILLGASRLLAWIVPVRWQRAGMARRALWAAGAVLGATVCAEIALAPVAALLFSRFTLAGLVLNFVAIPLMTVVQACALAVLALTSVSGGAAAAAGYVVHLAASGLVDSARLVDVVPWVSRSVPPPSPWVLAAYYGALLIAVLFVQLRPVAAGAAAGAILLILFVPAVAARDRVPHVRGTLRVVVFDVGQGDATAAHLPDGRVLLVDAGGLPFASALPPGSAASFDVGERVVVPALRALGVDRLEAFALTHAHPDHAGGAVAVARAFVPRAIWEGIPVPPDPLLRELRAAATRLDASWRRLQAGSFEEMGGASIEVLHPPPPDWERQRVRNDDSLALAIRQGRVSVVLPGDVGREGEQAMIPRLHADGLIVLKVPHHGSATSSTAEFLDALRPGVAIVSAGRQNTFGHPAPAVLARYRQRGIPIFRTDEDGAVIVETDGRTVTIRGWASGRSLTLEAVRDEHRERRQPQRTLRRLPVCRR